MKTIKNIIGGLLAFWALLSFIITFLIIFIPSMLCWLIPNPLGQKFLSVLPEYGCRSGYLLPSVVSE
jgi:1-acyl-sn-glycerol-3-phosphate acyltransferase